MATVWERGKELLARLRLCSLCIMFTCICNFSYIIFPVLGKRELICLLLFTCNLYVVSVEEDSSSSGCYVIYCGTP